MEEPRPSKSNRSFCSKVGLGKTAIKSTTDLQNQVA
ncbi:hypothetical protein AYI68_g4959, partial [Smittium mucronatum]